MWKWCCCCEKRYKSKRKYRVQMKPAMYFPRYIGPCSHCKTQMIILRDEKLSLRSSPSSSPCRWIFIWKCENETEYTTLKRDEMRNFMLWEHLHGENARIDRIKKKSYENFAHTLGYSAQLRTEKISK